MREWPSLYAFNRGLCSPLGLARIDQKRVALSAETMTNWIPRVLGSMSMRPGTAYIGATYFNHATRILPFVFATSDTALVEFTATSSAGTWIMRIWISDVLLTRVSVSTTVPFFIAGLAGWTDGSDAGGAIAYNATTTNLDLTGTGTARAIAYHTSAVIAADYAKEHTLQILVYSGPMTLKVGIANTYDDMVAETVLDTGMHQIAFTPNGPTFTVQLSSVYAYKVSIAYCIIVSGAMGLLPLFFGSLPTITSSDLGNIRYDQSADTVFLACKGSPQMKIERRGTRPGARSWSITLYQANDGPFLTQNFTPTTITASALVGDITLTASRPLFRLTHVGALWRLTNQVAVLSASISAENTFTTGLKVTGTGIQRSITVTITGTWVAVVTLQVSPDNSTWADVPGEVWNTNVTGPYLDGLDGQTRYYRIGVKTGNYTSGTVAVAIGFSSGTLDGIVRITGFTSSLTVSAQVLSDIGATTATSIWAEGTWSAYRGYPTAVRLHEGRLWWAGQNGLFGSVSDSFFSFNDNVIGDSGPINRTIGSGPVDTINGIISLQRLLLLAQGAEYTVKSSAFDTPLTPTDFTIKPASTQGSGVTDAVRIDQRAIFVDRTTAKVFEIVFDLQTYEYSSNDLTAIVPELGLPGIVRIAAQRKPDTRIHCVRSDGTVMVAVLDKVEDVMAWIEIESTGASGLIEDVVVLPAAAGSTEDQVYYVVNRTVNGSTVRYLEKWAKETECRGSTLNKQADAFIIYDGAPQTIMTGLSHLEGQSVIVWANGVDFSPGTTSQTTYTVTSGQITLASPVTNAIIGLPYTAQWKSTKLGMQQSLAQTILNQQKRVTHLGVIAAWFHAKGIQYGPDFDNLQDMPEIESGTTVGTNTIRTQYDEAEIPFPGRWETDSRICIQAQAPRPVTLLALVTDIVVQN